MAESIELLPEHVRVKIRVPTVTTRVEVPEISSEVDRENVPVVIVPGKQGPPGKDGAVIGGAVIDDGLPQANRVWSSEKTQDADNKLVEDLTPEINLTLLFNNALT